MPEGCADLQQLGGRATQYGVAPVRPDLAERDQHEVALVHLGVGQAQGLVLADDVVQCDEVEIDQPRPPARGLLAPVPPELGLDAMQPGQDRRRGQAVRSRTAPFRNSG